MKYSIVIPCYKSGKVLDELCRRIKAVLDPIGEYELILVNDASPDDITWPAIEKCADNYPFVKGFDLLTNAGQFRATMCGFEQALGDYIITMDDDLQHPPEELPKLINSIQSDSDTLCYMGRYREKHHSVIRNLGSRFYKEILHYLYGKPKDLQTSSPA